MSPIAPGDSYSELDEWISLLSPLVETADNILRASLVTFRSCLLAPSTVIPEEVPPDQPPPVRRIILKAGRKTAGAKFAAKKVGPNVGIRIAARATQASRKLMEEGRKDRKTLVRRISPSCWVVVGSSVPGKSRTFPTKAAALRHAGRLLSQSKQKKPKRKQ